MFAPPGPGPRIGSLFSGYGGLDEGIRSVLGGRVAWHAEVEPAACRLLAHRYPDAPNHGDVSAVDWSAVEPVDVLTGGFPCQDVSLNGRRRGIRPGTRSGLWSQFAYAIEQLRPGLVVIENVRGLLSAYAHRDLGSGGASLEDGELRALGAVLGDLADLGYDAAWQVVRAADVGAVHGRARVFVLGWPAPPGGPAAADAGGEAGELRAGLRADGAAGLGWARPDDGAARPGAGAGGADAGDPARWGQFAPAVARWERIVGRGAPDPLERRARGGRGLNPAFAEWMMGLPAGWVTAVPAPQPDQLDLFSAGLLSPEERYAASVEEQIKMLGNGVCPQQAAHALRVLLPHVDVAKAARAA